MGIWADVIKVMRSGRFKKELSSGNYSVSHSAKADKADKLGTLGSANNTKENRPVWFSDNETTGLPRKDKDNKFTYNTQTKTLNADNFAGNTLSINGQQVISSTRGLENVTSINGTPISLIPTSVPAVLIGDRKKFNLGEWSDTGIELPSGKSLDDVYQVGVFLFSDTSSVPAGYATGSVIYTGGYYHCAYSGSMKKINNGEIALTGVFRLSYGSNDKIRIIPDSETHRSHFSENGGFSGEGNGTITYYSFTSGTAFCNINVRIQLFFK